MGDNKDPINEPGHASWAPVPLPLLVTGLLAFGLDAAFGGASHEHPATFFSLAGSLLVAGIVVARTRMLELANHRKLHGAVVDAFGGQYNDEDSRRQWLEAQLVVALGLVCLLVGMGWMTFAPEFADDGSISWSHAVALIGFAAASLSVLETGLLRRADLRLVAEMHALGRLMKEHQFGKARANTPEVKS